jgi:hypothetical protein
VLVEQIEKLAFSRHETEHRDPMETGVMADMDWRMITRLLAKRTKPPAVGNESVEGRQGN